jgi:hypothetical protein
MQTRRKHPMFLLCACGHDLALMAVTKLEGAQQMGAADESPRNLSAPHRRDPVSLASEAPTAFAQAVVDVDTF